MSGIYLEYHIMKHSQFLQFSQQLAPAEGKSYSQIAFEVPPDTEYIAIQGHFTVSDGGVGTIDIGLSDADGCIRGWSGNLNRMERIFLGEEQASLGYLAGPLQAGTWQILLGDNRQHSSSINVELQLELIPSRPRILRGDVHGHSLYSDGSHSIETKLQMAKDNGLDFLGFTDHNSISQNSCLPVNPDVLLLPSCEITSYNGHVNIFGYRQHRIPDFMCRNSEDMRRILTDLKEEDARQAEARGENHSKKQLPLKQLPLMIQLNHPIRRGDVAGCQWNWDYNMPFDWIEVWNGAWNHNSIANVALWQSFLEQGRYLPATANSDFHILGPKSQGYPCNNIWVGKKTSADILQALHKGHNYLTAEPLPATSFAARCQFLPTQELVLFGSTVQFRQTLAPLVLELTVADSYLRNLGKLMLKAWNERGLCLKRQLNTSDFTECPRPESHEGLEMHNRHFRLELNDLVPKPEAATQDTVRGAGKFLRFELFRRAVTHSKEEGEAEETEALLLTNPVFFQAS